MEFYIVQKYISKTNESEIKAFSEKQKQYSSFPAENCSTSNTTGYLIW